MTPEKAKELLDGSPAGWFVLDEEGTFLYANATAAALLDADPEQLVGANAAAAFPDAVATAFGRHFERLRAGDDRVAFEEYLPGLDAWFQVEAARTDGGIWVWFRDVTEAHRGEQALRVLLEHVPSITWAVDRELRYTSLGGSARRDLPPARRARLGDRLEEIVTPEEVELHRRALAGEAVREDRAIDGRIWDVRVEPVYAPTGTVIGAAGAAFDVTEQRLVLEEVQQSEELHRLIVENAEQGIWTLDAFDVTTFVNPKLAQMFGYEPEEMIGTSVYEFMDEDWQVVAAETLERRRQGAHEELDFVFRRKDGTTFETSVIATPILDPDGRYVGALGLVTDVTEKRAAERTLAESERRFRAVFDGGKDAMLLADDERRYVDVNEAACRLFGRTREKLLRLRSEDVFAAGDVDATLPVWNAFLASGSAHGEFTYGHDDGTERVLEYASTANVLPGLHLSVLRDVTERKELEEQLLQSQKMETVGRLAGGVAHDFNNLLTAIGGYAQLALSRLPDDHLARADISEVLRGTERAAVLIRQLLAFSRRQVLAPKVIDVNGTVRDLHSMLRPMIGEQVQLVTLLADDVRPVRADPGQLQQVLVNLAVNARDAMPDGGRLAIATEDDGEGHVTLTVSDTGLGMDDATRAQIFEPFFTTKGPGEGTGLGLSTVYGIVSQSGGVIEVESTPGRGTTFTIRLPVTDDAPEPAVEDAAPAARPGHAPAVETVLLLEDEAVVRRLVREILERDGYEVIEAGDPEEAIAASVGTRSIDLLLTDVVMPGMSGPELARTLTRGRDDLKVLYMSGYSDDAIAQDGLLDPGSAFLQKPFRAQELTAKVRELLEA